MTQDEIIEAAIQGHASTRDAIRWSMQQEREECAKVCDDLEFDYWRSSEDQEWTPQDCAKAIRARS